MPKKKKTTGLIFSDKYRCSVCHKKITGEHFFCDNCKQRVCRKCIVKVGDKKICIDCAKGLS